MIITASSLMSIIIFIALIDYTIIEHFTTCNLLFRTCFLTQIWSDIFRYYWPDRETVSVRSVTKWKRGKLNDNNDFAHMWCRNCVSLTSARELIERTIGAELYRYAVYFAFKGALLLTWLLATLQKYILACCNAARFCHSPESLVAAIKKPRLSSLLLQSTYLRCHACCVIALLVESFIWKKLSYKSDQFHLVILWFDLLFCCWSSWPICKVRILIMVFYTCCHNIGKIMAILEHQVCHWSEKVRGLHFLLLVYIFCLSPNWDPRWCANEHHTNCEFLCLFITLQW